MVMKLIEVTDFKSEVGSDLRGCLASDTLWPLTICSTQAGLGKINKKLIKIKDQDHTVEKIKIEIRGKVIFNDLRSMKRSRSFLKNTVVKPHDASRIFINLVIDRFFRFYGYFICYLHFYSSLRSTELSGVEFIKFLGSIAPTLGTWILILATDHYVSDQDQRSKIIGSDLLPLKDQDHQ